MKNIVNYIFEIGVLKREKHNGFKLIGVDNLGSVAEHALRAAQIGYILTVLENEKHGTDISPERVASILIFHDNGEVRIGDLHKVASRYIDSKEAEQTAFVEQTERLPENMAKTLLEYYSEFENRNTKEGIIAKDADWLESAFSAKEHYDLGNTLAIDWILNVEKALETDSAKEMIKEMKETRFTDWWVNLKKMLYKKMDGNYVEHGKD
ncbi:MAG: HD domain-containing protein [Candidatus Pacebacteria bacterium]|nr:HD domain-containing protein [Candidatus Paceibacterota bacterium]MDD3919146.1 HD domain-containing protein [Candidatus Paceibacterota bacterium]